jgi:hypothetical protein
MKRMDDGPEYDDADERDNWEAREAEGWRESGFLEGPEWEHEKALADDEFWSQEYQYEAEQQRAHAQREVQDER